MRFVCDDQRFDVLDRAAIALSIDLSGVQKFIELDDQRLISIAQSLGMEELAQANSNEDAPVLSVSTQSGATADVPACEICGKPVASKRAKICSEECKREKSRRYAREYMRKIHANTDIEKPEDAGGGTPPLSSSEPVIPMPEWGSDPGDEPVRANGLG
ncbi:MAG: hypothetical protein ACYC3H_01300 [Bellilinea sp.]